ncbi:uncharacterized protein UDID_19605 [Ustilago sp. UG-2017a]|nr:uncharacterized protein UDID_19605 [Ustilago sp. UG-2017a]
MKQQIFRLFPHEVSKRPYCQSRPRSNLPTKGLASSRPIICGSSGTARLCTAWWDEGKFSATLFACVAPGFVATVQMANQALSSQAEDAKDPTLKDSLDRRFAWPQLFCCSSCLF